jgi:hypothetical protein
LHDSQVCQGKSKWQADGPRPDNRGCNEPGQAINKLAFQEGGRQGRTTLDKDMPSVTPGQVLQSRLQVCVLQMEPITRLSLEREVVRQRSRTDHHSQGLIRRRLTELIPHGQQRIVGKCRSSSDHHCGHLTTQLVRPGPGGITGDAQGSITRTTDATVQTHGHLQRHERFPGSLKMRPLRIELLPLTNREGPDDLDPMFPQRGSTTTVTWLRLTVDNPADSCR